MTELDAGMLQGIFSQNHELSAYATARAHEIPGSREAPDPYRTIGIIGGGTAGFLTAIALRQVLPALDVTLVESSDIPIIGVGEATVPNVLRFLHYVCKIDIHDFYEKVQPTWKQGIRFIWGQPGDYEFHYPFDGDMNGVGMLRMLQKRKSIAGFSLQSLLMEHNVTPILDLGQEKPVSFLHLVPFAYHLENRRLVKYLHEVAKERGVKHLDRKIGEVVLTPDGEQVDHLVTTSGEKLAFDLFIDCTGFRSLLLGQKLRVPFMSFERSLFTDRALTFSTPHDGKPEGYTTATTMDSGWTWTIPHVETNNHGYVFSSQFCTPEQAEREARATFPRMTDPHDLVKFRSGRYEACWKGNVLALGNASGFIEPLESTGILMIQVAVDALISLLPPSKSDRAARSLYNLYMARKWDGLRWFITMHYRFNQRKDTPFWITARKDADISGAQLLVDAFNELAPLYFRSARARQIIADVLPAATFFQLSGTDIILLGQRVPTRAFEAVEPESDWQLRLDLIRSLAPRALSMIDALRAVRAHPEMLDVLLQSPQSWLTAGDVPLLPG